MRRRDMTRSLTCLGFVFALLAGAVPAVGAQTAPSVLPLLSLSDGTLFPGMSEEVQIVEPWSRAMVDEVLAGDRILGLVTLQPESVPNPEGWQEIFPVGTVCVIDRATRLPDGRFFIVLRAVMTFRILSEDAGLAYRRAQIEARPEELAETDRDTLHGLRLRADELAKIVYPVLLPEMSDTERINSLAFYMDFDRFERQALLERHGIVSRAQALVELLTMKLATRR